MKVLIVKESNTESLNLSRFLSGEGYVIDAAANFPLASEKVKLYEYDCILFDYTSLGTQLFVLLKELGKGNKTDGVIVLSHPIEAGEKIDILDAGADDVLPATIDFLELSARVRAIIRRKKFQSKNKMYFGNLVIDLFAKTVNVWSTAAVLTRKEYEILLYLIANKDKIVSKISLSEYLWGENANDLDSFDALFTHIKNLRRKLKELKADVEFKSVYGVGYQIIEL